MSQLSFFSADYLPPVIADLAGLLAAHGQITSGSAGARLSILLADRGRAGALVTECVLRGVTATIVDVDGPGSQLLMRTARTHMLASLAREWTRGAVKSAPPALTVSPGLLRVWTLAAGRTDDRGYLLGVDPHAPENIDGLIAGCARAGLAGAYIGRRGGGPGIRIAGHRRLTRFIDTVGSLPSGLPAECYPVEPRPVASFELQP